MSHRYLSLSALLLLLVSDRGHLKSCHTGCNVTLKSVSTCLFINYIVWSFDMANGDDGNGKSMNVIPHSAYRQLFIGMVKTSWLFIVIIEYFTLKRRKRVGLGARRKNAGEVDSQKKRGKRA